MNPLFVFFMYRREQNRVVVEFLTKCPLKEYLSTVPEECPFKTYWDKNIVEKVKFIEGLSNIEITHLLRIHNTCEKKLLDKIGNRPMKL